MEYNDIVMLCQHIYVKIAFKMGMYAFQICAKGFLQRILVRTADEIS